MNIVSFSGGKDSSAMLLRMIELNKPIDKIIFADTGMEYPETYNQVNRIEKEIGQKIERLKPKKDWDYYFYRTVKKGKYAGQIKGFPFVVLPCWAQRDLKFNPLKKAQGKGNNVFIGITADEKHRISQYDKKNNYLFPLVEWNWSSKDCQQYLLKRKLLPETKFKRSGCWLCPKQTKHSLKTLYFEHPDLWKKLKRYEKDSPNGFNPNFSLEELEREWEAQTFL